VLLIILLSFNCFSQKIKLKKNKHYTVFVIGDTIKLNQTGQIKFRVKATKGFKFTNEYQHALKNLKLEGLKIQKREIKLSGDDVLDLNYTVIRTSKNPTLEGNLEFSIKGLPVNKVPFTIPDRTKARSSNDPIFFFPK